MPTLARTQPLKYRQFDGLRYTLISAHSQKRVANQFADNWRRRRYSARIIDVGGRYAVYVRNNRR